jgi:hypothetical protein
MHTSPRTYTHTRTHTHMHMREDGYTQLCPDTNTHTHARTHTYTVTHTSPPPQHTHQDTHINTPTGQTHAHTPARTYTHAQVHILRQMDLCNYVQTHTYPQACTPTPTVTCTHFFIDEKIIDASVNFRLQSIVPSTFNLSPVHTEAY